MTLSTASIIWRTFKKYRLHMGLLVVLGFMGAILEGIGINAAVPLLSFLLDGQSTPLDGITQIIKGFFAMLGLPFTFRFLLGFIVVLFLTRAVALAVFGYLRGWIIADFLYHETGAIMSKLFAASWPFLLQQKLGVVHSTMIRDLQRTSTLLGSVSQAIQSFTGFFIYLLVALNISPIMTLFTLIGGGVLLLVVRPFLSRTRRAGEEMSGTEKLLSQFITEHTMGMKSLKASGLQVRAMEAGDRLLALLRRLQIRLALVSSLSGSLFQPFTILFIIGMFAVTYQLPGFNLVSFIATLYLIQKIFTYLESGQSALHIISELVPYAQQTITFKHELSVNKEEKQPGQKPFVFNDAIAFSGVSLAYQAGEKTLSNLTFAIPAGKTTALIGPSGGGKTSVADLMLRLFEPTEGSITLDGVPAKEILLTEWRNAIGYVSQDIFLFNGTIEDNIRFYRPELTQEGIEEAARQANIYDFIMSLPEGFKTSTGDRGVMLSGGQRQRVVLARALVGKPKVLVLDEATSALDQESESLIQASIKNLHGKVTVFVIAHRLSTVENADHIIVLERGQIAEQGSPDELRAKPGSYFAKHSA